MEQTPVTTEHSIGAKRKRTPIPDSAPSLAVVANGSVASQISYLVKDRPEKLKIIEGDAETFGDVLSMIDDYEGVLQRRESLAANMGAKLVAPLLIKSFEKLFDGPIKVLQPSFALEQSPISWMDVVTFSHTNASEFILIETTPGVKSCRFWFKGGQIEISEDDYRLIVSGAPERMIPTQPIPEDETAELATLNILEARLTMLIKRADAVASKARQLNYHLKGRKNAFLSKKSAEQSDSIERNLSPQSLGSRSPAPPGSGDVGKAQRQLLEQFLIVPQQNSSRRASLALPRPKTGRVATVTEPFQPQVAGFVPPSMSSYNGFATTPSPGDNIDRRPSQTNTATSSDDGIENHYRVVMATRIDKLAKGDVIFPPCDRCRRLKFDCIKHISACAGCTKKHARCSWKDIRDRELEYSMPPQILQSQIRPPQLRENGEITPVNSGKGERLQHDGGMRSPLSGVAGPVSTDGQKVFNESQAARENEERWFAQAVKMGVANLDKAVPR